MGYANICNFKRRFPICMHAHVGFYIGHFIYFWTKGEMTKKFFYAPRYKLQYKRMYHDAYEKKIFIFLIAL